MMITPKQRQVLLMAFTTWVFCLLLGSTSGKSVSASFAPRDAAPTDSVQVMQQGRSAYQAGQYSQAIAFWQQALSGYQRQGDRLNQALSLSYLGLAQQQVGDFSNASQSIAKSLNLLSLEFSNPETPNQARILAQVLNTQGSLQFAQGQLEAALASWQRATEIYQKINEPALQIGSLLNQAQAQQSLGLLSQASKTLAKIEQLLQQQPNRQLQAQGLRSLGNLLLLTGELPRSRQALTTSLNIAEKLGAKSEIAATLISLGNAARLQNQPDQALQFYQRVGPIAPSPLLQTQAELNQISLQIEQGQAVSNLLTTVQTRLPTLPLSRSSIYARIHLGQSLIQLGKRGDREIYRSAADHLANAVQSARTLGDRRAETYALGYLGQVYEEVEQRSQAEKLTQQALLIAQTMNAPEITYQWQWQMGRLLRSQGSTATAKQSYTDAFQSLQSIRTDLAAVSPDLQFSFRERVEPVYREFVEVLLSAPNPTAEDLQQSRQVIESLRLAELDNFFRTACLEGKAVAIDRIAKTQTQSAVVYPIILPDRLAIILSTPGKSLQYYNVNVSQSELETALEQFRQYLERPITTPEGKRLGKQIYDWVIRPIAAELDQQSLDTLVFVLDGALRNVPLAALYDGQQYLIEKYGIALSPGLQLINPQPIQNRQLKAIAAGLTEGRHGFAALANVELELREIQEEVSSRVLLNQTFTSEALQQQVQALPYPIVHLATHGQFSSDASQTFVLAWDRPINVNELSALLSNREDLSEQAIELLVLSACETAQGDKRAALGLAGVAVQAGAKSTLASLWSLDDESGAKFIGAFYRELAKGQVSKAEALRQAQISLLRDRNFRHPRYWAPYVLLGNWL